MRTSRAILDAAVVATVLCALNAPKPPVADDPAYLKYAEQIAAHPADPYGFHIHWYDLPQPANTVLAPPVFLYWVGLGIRLVGPDPALLKLWCWPWCFGFTAGLSSLLHRFATGIERPMLWSIALSPAVLPGINLMLDVPALALSLLAINAMLASAARNSFDLAAVAGVAAGLAMQTKYTAFTTPVVLAVAAGRRRWRLSVVAGLAAVGTFAAWEGFVAQRYGESHFLYHLTHGEGNARRANLIGPLVTLVGGVGGALVPLGLAAFQASARIVGMAVGAIVASYVGIAVAPLNGSREWLSWETLSFGLTGTVALGLLARGAVAARGDGRFLAAWLAVEVVGYFALTPWPAARRVLAIVVVGALLLAWLAARGKARRGLVVAAAGLSVSLGLLYQASDIDGACATRSAVRKIDAWRLARRDNRPVLFVGRHGMQSEAERAGWFKEPQDVQFGTGDDWYRVGLRSGAVLGSGSNPMWETLRVVPLTRRLPFATQPAYSGMKIPMVRAVPESLVIGQTHTERDR